MRKSRFGEEQIIGILKESEAGVPTAELYRKHGIAGPDAVPLEGEVRRAGGQRGQAAAGAGGGEPAAEARGGRAAAGQPCARAGKEASRKLRCR